MQFACLSLVFMLGHCVNIKAMRYESERFNSAVAGLKCVHLVA